MRLPGIRNGKEGRERRLSVRSNPAHFLVLVFAQNLN